MKNSSRESERIANIAMVNATRAFHEADHEVRRAPKWRMAESSDVEAEIDRRRSVKVQCAIDLAKKALAIAETKGAVKYAKDAVAYCESMI